MKYNPEQQEALQKEADGKLDKFQKSLDDEKQKAMKQLRVAIQTCEKSKVPIVVFAKFMPDGFHQWHGWVENGNEDKYADDYYRKSWSTIGHQYSLTCLNFISKIFAVRIRVFSKVGNYLMLDTDPEPEQRYNDNNE